MSEIITDKLTGKAAAGNVTITSEGGAVTMQLQQGLAKAWISLTVAAAIESSLNVSSITDVGTGEFDPQLTNSMSDALYCCNTGVDLTGHVVRSGATESRTTSSFKVISYTTHSTGASESAIDGLHNASFGDLA